MTDTPDPAIQGSKMMDAETKALVERLRGGKCPECKGWGEISYGGEMVSCRCNGRYESQISVEARHQSADLIERLAAENARLRDALRPFARMADVFEASISKSDAAGLSHEEARLRAYQSLIELRFAGHLDRARAALAGEVGHD